MKKILAFLIVAYSCLCIYDATRPVDHYNVSVIVKRGDCLQNIICDLQEKFGDKRDWREIAHSVRKKHGITKWIMPGQELIIPLEVKR